jgi:hypothetical protein
LDPSISKVIGPVLSAVAAAWMMQAMVRASRRQATLGADGTPVLRYPRYMAWLGIAGGLLGLAIAVFGSMQEGTKSLSGLALVVGIGGAMAFGGGWMMLEGARRTIRVGETQLEMTPTWGDPVVIPWSTVTVVRFRNVAGYLVVEGVGGMRIESSVALVGLQSLVDRIKVKVPEPSWREALVQLEAYRDRQGGKQ